MRMPIDDSKERLGSVLVLAVLAATAFVVWRALQAGPPYSLADADAALLALPVISCPPHDSDANPVCTWGGWSIHLTDDFAICRFRNPRDHIIMSGSREWGVTIRSTTADTAPPLSSTEVEQLADAFRLDGDANQIAC